MTPELRRAFAEFSQAAGLLQNIHSGSTNEAIQTLEENLETNLLIIGAAFEEVKLSERDRGHCISRIRWFREYRAAHPRSGKAGDQTFLDGEMTHILSLVETNR